MENKIVWLFNHYAQGPDSSGGARHFSLAKHLKELDWDMVIIAASTNHSTGKQRLMTGSFLRQTIDDVFFVWLKTPEYKGSGISRIRNMLAYSFRAYLGVWKSSQKKPDIIIGSSVHPFAAISAALLAKKYSVPFIFEVRDLWPETLIALGHWNRKSWKTRILKGVEKWLYKRADKIITLLPYADEYISSVGGGDNNNKIIWLPNGIDIIEMPPVSNIDKRADEYFTMMYLGSHGQANNLECIIEAMSVLKENPKMRHVKLRLIGAGPAKEALKNLAGKLNLLSDISFEGPVSKNKVPALAREADAFIIAVKDLPELYRYGISMNKLFEYLAAERPIIIASNARNNPVEDAKAGITVPAESPSKLAEAIEMLVSLPEEKRLQMGKSGRLYAKQKHDYKILSIKLASLLNASVSKDI